MSSIKREPKIFDLVTWMNGTCELSESMLNKPLPDIWMDSRRIAKGDIFLAIKGEVSDGHDYVENAILSGAVATIVAKSKVKKISPKVLKKCIVVTDPLNSVSRAASKYRKQLGIPFIGITGSNGKTTTRHFITEVLSGYYNVGMTNGNWNNHIGVPLSVLRLSGREDLAVLELGANHSGEISHLSKMIKPDVAIITNVSYAHIGLFGSLDNTAKTKLEITDGLRGKDSLLLINGDDRRLKKNNVYEALTFGLSRTCAVRAEDISCDKDGLYSFKVKDINFKLGIPGEHFIYSALPAIFIALQMGMPAEILQEKIRSVKAEDMRGGISVKKGIRFIVDCYNANPDSMKSSIKLLTDVSLKSKRIAIVGDMLELGKFAKQQHKKLGKLLFVSGVSRVIAVGKYAELVVDTACAEGLKKKKCIAVETASDALVELKKIARKDDVVLLKGSRKIKLETIWENY